MNGNLPTAGWYLDPTGLSDGRYWDGAVWTAVVSRSGVTSTNPVDPTRAAVPPLPGTAIRPPITAPAADSSDRSAVTIGIGVMLAALVALLVIAIISTNGSDETPPAVTNPTATAPAATDRAEGG